MSQYHFYIVSSNRSKKEFNMIKGLQSIHGTKLCSTDQRSIYFILVKFILFSYNYFPWILVGSLFNHLNKFMCIYISIQLPYFPSLFNHLNKFMCIYYISIQLAYFLKLLKPLKWKVQKFNLHGKLFHFPVYASQCEVNQEEKPRGDFFCL